MPIPIPAGVVLAALAATIVLLVVVARKVRQPGSGGLAAVLIVMALIVAPVVMLAAASGRLIADMKTVDACASCHVMDHFVTDMRDTASLTLAARHLRADSMPVTACYSCHTGYGVFGSMAAKKDGLKHWWRFMTASWQEPIQIHGGYRNANCLACHPVEPMFADSIPLHVALQDSIMADAITCFLCHGEPHARHAVPGLIMERAN
jgi:nitrate/TMAO reductase-like tetraheme cytochrome c subunit